MSERLPNDEILQPPPTDSLWGRNASRVFLLVGLASVALCTEILGMAAPSKNRFKPTRFGLAISPSIHNVCVPIGSVMFGVICGSFGPFKSGPARESARIKRLNALGDGPEDVSHK